MNKPKITAEVDNIDLYPGQALTVWLNGFSQYDGRREAVQVELRVVPGKYGKHEIYISEKFTGAQVHHGFDDWYPIEAKS